MSGRPMVPGGPTNRAAQNGGQELYIKLQLLLAGEAMPVAMFALIETLGAIAIELGTTKEESKATVDLIAGDAKNFIDLNFDEVSADVALNRPLRSGAVQ